MKRNDLDPFITEPDDEPDTTKCQACSTKFGRGLGEVSRSQGLKELCQPCYDELQQAYSVDRDFDQPEPDEPFDSLEDLGNVA